MYLSHWKLNSSPFAGRMDIQRFFPSSAHQEALARLEFLVANHRPLGLLLGPSGTGKSLLLHKLAHRLTRRGCRVALAALVGSSPEELLWNLTAQLGCGERSESPSRLWTRLSDRIEENRRLRIATVFLLDDVDAASLELQLLLIRLIHADPSPEAQHTLVLTCEASQVDRVSGRLFDLVDLRVDLDYWTEAETADYLQASLAEAGCSDNFFTEEAVTQIHQLSGGNPRQINRLADLALVAAAGQQCELVDSETVAAVAGELVAC